MIDIQKRRFFSIFFLLVLCVGIASADVCPYGIVSYWKGEGNGKDSYGNNNGFMLGGLGYGKGKIGRAFNFDGRGDSIELRNSTGLDITEEMTILVWVKVPSGDVVSETMTIIGKDDGSNHSGKAGSKNDVFLFRAHPVTSIIDS